MPSYSHGPSQTKVFLALVLNTACSIGIVLVNKYIYVHYHFPNITLTCIHFIVTFMGLLICNRLKVFDVKSLPISDMVPISLFFGGFVVFTNLSLQFNTVGTYQLIKSMTTPCIMVIQTVGYNRKFSWPIRLTFVPVCIGVFINSYYDVRFNLLGTFFAAVGVIVTSMYQVLVGEKQAELTANPMQLLFYQAPLSAAMLAFIIPFFEPVVSKGGVLAASWSTYQLFVVFMSGVIAFLVNLSIFWIIGKTSPLSYNMAGHLKFIAALMLGVLFFKEPVSLNQCLGMALTLSGVFMYSYLKLTEIKASEIPK